MFKYLFNKIRYPICNSKKNDSIGWGADKFQEFKIRHCNKCNTGFWLYDDGIIEVENIYNDYNSEIDKAIATLQNMNNIEDLQVKYKEYFKKDNE